VPIEIEIEIVIEIEIEIEIEGSLTKDSTLALEFDCQIVPPTRSEPGQAVCATRHLFESP
jgi:hypothetical protein